MHISHTLKSTFPVSTKNHVVELLLGVGHLLAYNFFHEPLMEQSAGVDFLLIFAVGIGDDFNLVTDGQRCSEEGRAEVGHRQSGGGLDNQCQVTLEVAHALFVLIQTVLFVQDFVIEPDGRIYANVSGNLPQVDDPLQLIGLGLFNFADEELAANIENNGRLLATHDVGEEGCERLAISAIDVEAHVPLAVVNFVDLLRRELSLVS